MDEKCKDLPTLEQIRLIFRDTYNFYLRWKNINDEKYWNLLIQEEHDLYRKYPFDLCKHILVEILTVIKTSYEKGVNDEI